MASIKLQNIAKVYPGNVTAVHDLSLYIEDKEFLVLVGPSGCGKSTILRMIAGLEEITGGELYIGENLVNDIAPKDRDIAMVFQNYALYPHMTVYKNMAFGLTLRKMPKAEIDRKVKEAAKILDIEGLLQRKPKALSGGQRQRVALGRAMVRNPAVFLLDEPLSNLDAKLRNTMRAEIALLHKRLGTTFVYVTHDQTEAMTMGDRIVVLKDGYIQQVDTPQNLYDKPCNIFVAGFIGTPQMNFLPATVIREGSAYFVEFSGTRLPLLPGRVPEHVIAPYAGREIMLGIRPEDIRVDEAGKDGALEAEVDIAELMGAETYLNATCAGSRIVARIPGRFAAKNQTAVRLVPDSALLHLFDKDTQASIIFPPAAEQQQA